MTVLTKSQAIAVIRRAHGPEVAASLAEQLPDTVDLENPKHAALLAKLGLSRDQLFNDLGAEL